MFTIWGHYRSIFFLGTTIHGYCDNDNFIQSQWEFSQSFVAASLVGYLWGSRFTHESTSYLSSEKLAMSYFDSVIDSASQR